MKLAALASMVLASAVSAQASQFEPIASIFDVNQYILTDRRIPPDSGADVGAFRFTCMPTYVGRNDPIVYPQQEFAGHGHQNSGDGSLGGFETYQSLRTNPTVLTSCTGHHVNRSRYWVPWLQTAQGQILRPDVFVVYYKHSQAADGTPCSGVNSQLPVCQALKEIPVGLQLVVGWNMNESDPAKIAENQKHIYWTCQRGSGYIQVPPPNTYAVRSARLLYDAGCGAEDGDILTGKVSFPICANLNSTAPDKRSHVVSTIRDNNTGLSTCPASHFNTIPLITQQWAYTLKRAYFEWGADGKPVRGPHLSSDIMGNVRHPEGSTLHADYMEGWDRPILSRWHKNCVVGHRSCQEAEFGDGTAGFYPEPWKGFTVAQRQESPFYESPVEAPAPSLLITAVATPIPEGQPAFFKITASRAVAGDTILHVLIGTGEHIMITLPANATTVEFSVPTVSDGKHGTASPPATASLEDGTTATVVLGDIDPPPPPSGAAYEARPVPKRANSFDFFQAVPVEERGVSSIQRGEAVWLCEEIKALNPQVTCVVR